MGRLCATTSDELERTALAGGGCSAVLLHKMSALLVSLACSLRGESFCWTELQLGGPAGSAAFLCRFKT